MKPIWYNNQKVCDLTSFEYEALCLLLPYWGLQIAEDDETISGALSTFMVGLHGLSQQKINELEQLLQHTGITITTNDHVKCDQRFYVDFHASHPMPLALNTPDKQLYYLNPATSFGLPVQSAIHKGITLKRKDGPLFLAVQPAFEKQIAEWISYLVIQSFLRFSFESLTSLSESTFISCADKVLRQVNATFAAVQNPQENVDTTNGKKGEKIDHQNPSPAAERKKIDLAFEEIEQDSIPYIHVQKVTVPQIRPFSARGSLITNNIPKPFEQGQFMEQNEHPINPFKSKTFKEQPIQPFNLNSSDSNGKSVIRPFQSNQNTPSSYREYNVKGSSIFRKRRDGK